MAKLVCVMEAGEGTGVYADLIDQEIKRILKAHDQQRLTHNADSIREQIEGVLRYMDVIAGKLKQIKGEMVGQGIDPTSLGDYVVKFFMGGT